jgi:cephalosporin hydroxylase
MFGVSTYIPDTEELKKELLASAIARFDLIIDDGPHTDEAILSTFKELFPLISDQGYYVVEDNLTVKSDLAALAQKFGGLVKRNGDLPVVTRINQ